MTLIGHTATLDEIDASFARDERLVVLKGPPGVGKTRVARAWALRHAEPKPIFCDLSGARTAEDVALVLGRELGVATRAPSAGSLETGIEEALRARPGQVLVLDEIERLDEHGLRFVGRLADAGTPLLATSRVRPRLAREHVVPIEPLAYPADPSDEGAGQLDSVVLFLALARRKGGLRDVDARVIAHVAAIARRLEGLPLALELAAARTPGTPLERLREDLERSVAAVGAADLDARAGHRSLHAAVASSLDQLDAETRGVLDHAVMLPAEIDLDELEAMSGAAAGALGGSLERLVDHSLISVRPTGLASQLAYGVHAVIREVVLARASPERVLALESKHAAFRARQARALALEHDTKSIAKLARAEPGIRAAWAWAREREDDPDSIAIAADLAWGLGHLAEALGVSPVVVDVLERAVCMPGVSALDRTRRAALWFYRGFAHLCLSQLSEARAAYERALALAAGESWRFEALAWCQIAWLDARDGRIADAERAAERGVRALAGRTDPITELRLGSLRAQLDLRRGRMMSARRGFERAHALAVRTGDGANEASALGFLGSVAHDEGALDDALAYYDRALAIATRESAGFMGAVFRGYRAMVLDQQGREGAEEAYLEAIAHAERASLRFTTLFRAWYGGWLACHGRLEDAERVLDHGDVLADRESTSTFSLQRGQLDLARAERARAAGRADEARRHEALACLRLLDARLHAPDVAREVRLAAVLLLRSLAHRVGDSAAGTGDARFVVGWEGEWFALDGARVDLKAQHVLRRLVWTLALHAITEPGTTVDVETLVGVVWAGERLAPEATRHRLRVAVSTLRKLGLRDVLESDRKGYRFAREGVPVIDHPAAEGRRR